MFDSFLCEPIYSLKQFYRYGFKGSKRNGIVFFVFFRTAEVTEPRDSDTKYYDVNETQFFDAKMPDEVVIEKEVTEYRFEQHNKGNQIYFIS